LAEIEDITRRNMMRIEPIEKARLEAIESKMMQEEFNLPD
jgi:hypothetical protein